MMWFSILVAVLTAYLLGNLNGAVCMSQLRHDDVRAHGSGNAGLTNYIRSYGAASSVFVILIDAGKALLACQAAGLLLQPYGYYLEGRVLGGVMVMLGHDFPALLGFKGGKGILSGFMVALSIDWRLGLAVFGVFVIVYFLTQYVSLSSVLATVCFAVAGVVMHRDNWAVMAGAAFMGVLTVWMHRGNLQRLIRGQEQKTNLFGKGCKQ